MDTQGIVNKISAFIERYENTKVEPPDNIKGRIFLSGENGITEFDFKCAEYGFVIYETEFYGDKKFYLLSKIINVFKGYIEDELSHDAAIMFVEPPATEEWKEWLNKNDFKRVNSYPDKVAYARYIDSNYLPLECYKRNYRGKWYYAPDNSGE